MKKYFLIIITLLMVIPFKVLATIGTASNVNYLNIYLICKEKEEDCLLMEKELNNYIKENNNYTLIKINSEEESDLVEEIKENLNIKSNKLPLVVIGTNYFLGNSKNTQEKIKDAINAYQYRKHCDLVNNIKNNEKLDECFETNEEIYEDKYPWLLIVTIIGTTISLISIFSIIFYNKKKK